MTATDDRTTTPQSTRTPSAHRRLPRTRAAVAAALVVLAFCWALGAGDAARSVSLLVLMLATAHAAVECDQVRWLPRRRRA